MPVSHIFTCTPIPSHFLLKKNVPRTKEYTTTRTNPGFGNGACNIHVDDKRDDDDDDDDYSTFHVRDTVHMGYNGTTINNTSGSTCTGGVVII